MKKKIVVTGGAGFVGSNLISYLVKETRYEILSIDNYISGTKSNHIKSKRVKYIRCDTKDIKKTLKNPKKIQAIFHFDEILRYLI